MGFYLKVVAAARIYDRAKLKNILFTTFIRGHEQKAKKNIQL